MNKEQRFHELAASVQDEVARVIAAVDPAEVSAFITCLWTRNGSSLPATGAPGCR